jgi:Ni2+-binding GTPase involved in maturation of urease and hydrogenase
VNAAGPVGAGKTTFIERQLDAEVAFAICVRAERDAKLRKEQESASQSSGRVPLQASGCANADRRVSGVE